VINIIEVDYDKGAFAKEVLAFSIVPTEYTGKKVLAVPRCCQKKRGTQDRERINRLVVERDGENQTQDVVTKRIFKESTSSTILATASLLIVALAICYSYLNQYLRR
jgi:hypothetical protein